MSRIVCIDYGLKRCGMAATDILRIAAHPVDTFATDKFFEYLMNYLAAEDVAEIVIGDGKHHDGADSVVTVAVRAFAQKITKVHKNLKITLVDESYSSAEAKQVLLRAGMKRKKRQEKGMLDKVSAVIILQRYLGHI